MQKHQACGNGNADTAVFSEPQFRAALRREFRRTERSGRSFVLALAAAGTACLNGNGSARLEEISLALVPAVRESDIVGWYRQNETLGAIFIEIPQAGRDAALASIKQKLLRVMDEKLGPDAREVTVSFRLFPEDSKAGGESPLSDLKPDQERKAVARVLKRTIDLASSAVALVVLFPAFLAVATVIKLTSKGPVFFRQRRIGWKGKEFTFLKFRSMYVNSDVTLHRTYVRRFIAGKAAMQRSPDGKASAYKVINDPRVTPFGHFLRKSSLDELPQLINVLKGEMSLVGPRPPIPYELACYESWHLRRIVEAKPGITGLWQVRGRSKTSFDDMVRIDLRYARSWSLSLDFQILLKTPGAVLSREGAY